MQLLKKLYLLVSLFLMGSLSFAWAESANETLLYVQAVQVPLKAEPKMNAADIQILKRGDPLTVIQQEGIWYHVNTTQQKGWVSKLFVNSYKPIGYAV